MKRVITSLVSLCLAACLAFPAGALDYTIAAPGDPEYGDPTSIDGFSCVTLIISG